MASLRRAFAWSLVGNTVYNVAQWLLVVAIARLGTSTMVGQFAFAQALAAPVFLTVGFNLRAVRATDVQRRWTPGQYRQLRFLLNVASLTVVTVVGLIVGQTGAVLAVTLLISMAKSAEATSQLLYGFFQARDRMDLVSRSFLLRAALGAPAFVVALRLTGSLPEACAGLVIGWTTVYYLHDAPQERRLLRTEPVPTGRRPRYRGTLRSLAWTAAPLGADAGVGSLANSMPRYSVQGQLGAAVLGSYAALAYLGQIATLITGALADAVIGRLAIQADRRDADGFRHSVQVLLLVGSLLGGTGVVGAWLLGAPVIRLLLGREYVNQPLLIWLMVAAGATTIQRCLGRGLQATHRFSWVLGVDALTLVVTAVTVPILVGRVGVVGAAEGVAVAWGVSSLVAAVLVRSEIRAMRLAARSVQTTMGA